MSRGGTPAVLAPLGITFLHQAFSSFFLMAAAILAPLLAERTQAPSSLIGLYMSIAYLAAVSSSGLSGLAFARFGALTFSTACVVMTALGFLLLRQDSVWMIGFAAVLIGLGYGPLTPASSHVLAALSPPRWKNTVLAVKQTGVPLGGMAAGLVLPWLVLTLGWTVGLLLPATLALIATSAFLSSCRRIDRQAPTASSGWRHQLGGVSPRWMLPLGLGAFCYAGVQMSLSTFLALYFVEHIGLTVQGAGAMVAVFQSSGLLMRMAWGNLCDKLGHRVPFFSLIGGSIFLSLGIFLTFIDSDQPIWNYFLYSFLIGLFCNSWTGLYFAEIIRIVPAERVGSVTGIALMFTFSGVVMAPPVIGFVITMFDYSVAFFMIACLGIVGATAAFLAQPSVLR